MMVKVKEPNLVAECNKSERVEMKMLSFVWAGAVEDWFAQ
jgi:hypothetical protein